MSTSCKTSEKFYIQSPIDASVFLPQQPSIEYKQIEKDNSVKIEVPSDSYVGYVILKDRQNSLDIPIGISTYHKSRNGTRVAGIVTLFLVPPVGLAIAIRADWNQWAYFGEYSYDKYQRAAVDGLSPILLRQDPPKDTTNASSHSKRRKYSSAGYNTSASTTSKAKTKNRNLSGAVVGTYLCSGKLMIHNATDEEYPSVQIVIDQIDKTHVSVKVIESGESFFESPMEYTVKANGMNGYILTLEGVPDATIEITKPGKITFLHKKVNINGDIYTLSIKGNKRD